MYSINGTNIRLTRGDTLKVLLDLYQGDEQYTPQEGDVIRFAMKKSYADAEPLISRTIPNDTLLLHLEPADTKELSFGSYLYDIQITLANGDVDTFIKEAHLELTPEVD